MAEALKDFFDRDVVVRIADRFAAAWSGFPRARFVKEAVTGLDALELKPRAAHIKDALDRSLPKPFPDAARIVHDALGPPLHSTDGWGMAPFEYLPHVLWVAERGLDHFDEAMHLQHALTKRFSCEFSIRPYLVRHERRTLDLLAKWTRDPDAHVRRLVSEGTRPRLPWAMRLPQFIRDPTPTLPLLEALKDDPEEYVRRSVANHLNDIAKDHPAVTVATCARWMEAPTRERTRLVKHALRTLVKAGDAGALGILGAGDPGRIEASGTLSVRRAPIGGSFAVEATVRNLAREARTIVVDLRVYYVKANGDAAPKTFKMSTLELGGRASGTARTTVSLRQMTTRRHFPGVHRVALVVNGREVPVGELRVTSG